MIYQDNDKIFVAEVPELAGCAAHGETQIEAVKISTKPSNYGLKSPANSAMRFPNRAGIN